MYDKLAKQISKILEEVALPAALKEQLAQVKDFPGLLRVLFDVEAAIADKATRELANYRTDIPIAAQKDRSGPIVQLADALFGAYEAVVKTSGAVPEASGDLGKVIASLELGRTIAKDSDLLTLEKEFLVNVRAFVVLALWVSSLRKPGQRLITSLAETGRRISIGIVYKSEPSSLLAAPMAPGAEAKKDPTASETSGKESESQIRDHLTKIVPGAGRDSELNAPVYAGMVDDRRRRSRPFRWGGGAEHSSRIGFVQREGDSVLLTTSGRADARVDPRGPQRAR